MPVLNFMARFADAVERGEKRQTIRKRRKDGRDPKPGDTLYLYTGMRTKKCRRLGMAVCQRVEEVAFGRMELGGQRGTWFQGPGYLKSVARRDGFDSEDEMLDCIEQMQGLPFEGLLIRW